MPVTVTKTEYPNFGKVVLSTQETGIMISTELYADMVGLRMSDEDMFEAMKVN